MLKTTTIEERKVIYSRMLKIWRYCKDNNTMYYPIELLPEINIERRELIKEGDTKR